MISFESFHGIWNVHSVALRLVADIDTMNEVDRDPVGDSYVVDLYNTFHLIQKIATLRHWLRVACRSPDLTGSNGFLYEVISVSSQLGSVNDIVQRHCQDTEIIYHDMDESITDLLYNQPCQTSSGSSSSKSTNTLVRAIRSVQLHG
jgi:hypothetical protein